MSDTSTTILSNWRWVLPSTDTWNHQGCGCSTHNGNIASICAEHHEKQIEEWRVIVRGLLNPNCEKCGADFEDGGECWWPMGPCDLSTGEKCPCHEEFFERARAKLEP